MSVVLLEILGFLTPVLYYLENIIGTEISFRLCILQWIWCNEYMMHALVYFIWFELKEIIKRMAAKVPSWEGTRECEAACLLVIWAECWLQLIQKLSIAPLDLDCMEIIFHPFYIFCDLQWGHVFSMTPKPWPDPGLAGVRGIVGPLGAVAHQKKGD